MHRHCFVFPPGGPRGALIPLVVLSWLVIPGVQVAAQATAAEKAAAEALFDEGLSLMKQRQFAAACQKLEQSQAVEPGIGTQLYLAECYAKVGRTASAWASFREAASAAQAQGQTARAAAGSARAAELEPLLSRLTIAIAPEAQAIAGLSVVYDGSPMATEVWGTPFPVDPGQHVLTASAPGHQTWSETVTVAGQGVSLQVTVPPLLVQPEPVAQASPAGPAPVAPTASVGGATTAASDGFSPSGAQLAGIITAGVGVVSLGVGTYFGLRAISKNNESETGCGGGLCNSMDAYDAGSEAYDAATLSNIFVFGGLAAVATGAVLFFLVHSPDEAPRVALSADVTRDGRGGGLRIAGVF